MKKYLLKTAGALLCLLPIYSHSQTNEMMLQGKVLQITMENKKPMLIDTKGNKMDLSLGVLVNACAEAFLNAENILAPIKMDPNAITLIRLEKSGTSVKSTCLDPTGREEPLNLGVLLSSAAETYPNCNADQINGKTATMDFKFIKDKKGHIQMYLMEVNGGKEAFDLGPMVRDLTLRLNNCQ